MKKSDFYYDLPEHLIAQTPTDKRDGSRLLKINKATGEYVHSKFIEIKSFLKPGDCLVINDSKVIPARLYGTSGETKVEVLLHERIDENKWTALTKPGKKTKEGDVIDFRGKMTGVVTSILEDGIRELTLDYEGDFWELLDEIGEMPLPHYIEEKQEDTSRYQTVYADKEGSVAAPTAGLHFTENILKEISDMGVNIARVTLHVGIGTFRPVKTDNIEEHYMHTEFCQISKDAADLINQTKNSGGRVIAIGTTSCRTIESFADNNNVRTGSHKTDIFMYPGYEFKITDGLLTNFHLPESTLIMLVSAFMGRELTISMYQTAIDNEYRFFSYGDAMLIL